MCEYCNTQDCRTCAKAHIEVSKYREEGCFDASLYLDCENECGMTIVVDCAYQPVSYCRECGQYLGKNEPLTLEELKQMDGEVVWSEPINKLYELKYLAIDLSNIVLTLLMKTSVVYRHKPLKEQTDE